MIPKIIHQTWKNHDIPPAWRGFVDTWKRLHPGWEYRFWTDTDNDAFVARHFPEFLETWRGYPYAIMRADAIRYLLLLHYGGLYVDMDCECLAPMDPFLPCRRFIAGREPSCHEKEHGYRDIPSNALMMAPAGNTACRSIIDHLRDDTAPCVVHADVLHRTGPLMLHKVLPALDPEAWQLEEALRFSPLPGNSRELGILREGGRDAALLREALRRRGGFAVHHWDNSWTTCLAGELVNPDPEAVGGFRFIQGHFFVGSDMSNGGRDVARLRELCLAEPAAVGFNTDGFLKDDVPHKHEWLRYPGQAHNVGTYIKDSVCQQLSMGSRRLRGTGSEEPRLPLHASRALGSR